MTFSVIVFLNEIAATEILSKESSPRTAASLSFSAFALFASTLFSFPVFTTNNLYKLLHNLNVVPLQWVSYQDSDHRKVERKAENCMSMALLCE